MNEKLDELNLTERQKAAGGCVSLSPFASPSPNRSSSTCCSRSVRRATPDGLFQAGFVRDSGQRRERAVVWTWMGKEVDGRVCERG
jgi:hypothetical protein